MPDPITVLVTGATGSQGGAVVRALLDAGHHVRALVRDPGTQTARVLEATGARLATGDLDHPGSLRAAARGVYGVFSVQPNYVPAPDRDREIRQGQNVADAAIDSGARHLVYSSVGAAPHGSGVTHFQTKYQIEAYIARLGIPATVLRPVYFMDNWTRFLSDTRNSERVIPLALDPDTSLQMVAVADIGRIAAEVFAHPEEFIGQAIDLAGDELTVRQIAEAFTRADGIPSRFTQQAIEQSGPGDVPAMHDWLNTTTFRVDITALRDRHPDLLTLDAWLRTQRMAA